MTSIIVQGLLSDDLVSQGYAAAEPPPPPPPAVVTAARPLADSAGATGGYLVDSTFGGNYPHAGNSWTSSMKPDDSATIELVRRKRAVVVALAAQLRREREELL